MKDRKKTVLSGRLDRNSPVSLYYQLKNMVTSAIEEGILAKGDKLPTEQELIEEFDVSRTTVRLALQELKAEGYISAIPGKGSFVAAPLVNFNASKLLGFSEEIQLLGYQPGTRLIAVDQIECEAQIAKELQIEVGPRILRVSRLRLADNRPIGLATSYLNSIRFPDLWNQDYNQLSLYKIFEEKMDLQITGATQRIGAGLATENEAKYLEVQIGTPMLRVQRTTLVEDGIPVDYVKAGFDATIFEYYSELKRSK